MTMPEKLLPGPLASEISFFAPLSLFFFFLVIFIVIFVGWAFLLFICRSLIWLIIPISMLLSGLLRCAGVSGRYLSAASHGDTTRRARGRGRTDIYLALLSLRVLI
ncbi:MAG TPA: hypothetical protein VHZ74_19500 [Bryobacteraceae bacterium]|nr:hypothetical protein [Bryobacteraceae bacterium]